MEQEDGYAYKIFSISAKIQNYTIEYWKTIQPTLMR